VVDLGTAASQETSPKTYDPETIQSIRTLCILLSPVSQELLLKTVKSQGCNLGILFRITFRNLRVTTNGKGLHRLMLEINIDLLKRCSNDVRRNISASQDRVTTRLVTDLRLRKISWLVNEAAHLCLQRSPSYCRQARTVYRPEEHND